MMLKAQLNHTHSHSTRARPRFNLHLNPQSPTIPAATHTTLKGPRHLTTHTHHNPHPIAQDSTPTLPDEYKDTGDIQVN
jgi:hypothetical protein